MQHALINLQNDMKSVQGEIKDMKAQLLKLESSRGSSRAVRATATATAAAPTAAKMESGEAEDDDFEEGDGVLTPQGASTPGRTPKYKRDKYPGVAGITVKSELVRLITEPDLLQQKKETARALGQTLEKRAMYDRDYRLFMGVHPAIAYSTGGNIYTFAMTFVAMAVTNEQWATILGYQLDATARDYLFDTIQARTMEIAMELEVEAGNRDHSKRPKCGPTIHSLGKRFRSLRRKWEEQGKTKEQIDAIIREKTGAGDVAEKTEAVDVAEEKTGAGDLEMIKV